MEEYWEEDDWDEEDLKDFLNQVEKHVLKEASGI